MLRNAFENLATDGIVKAVLDHLRAIQRNTSYARDLNDRVRIVMDNSPQILVKTANNGSSSLQGGGLNPSHWSVDSWNIVDDRWEFANGLNSAFYSGTRSRWNIT